MDDIDALIQAIRNVARATDLLPANGVGSAACLKTYVMARQAEEVAMAIEARRTARAEPGETEAE